MEDPKQLQGDEGLIQLLMKSPTDPKKVGSALNLRGENAFVEYQKAFDIGPDAQKKIIDKLMTQVEEIRTNADPNAFDKALAELLIRFMRRGLLLKIADKKAKPDNEARDKSIADWRRHQDEIYEAQHQVKLKRIRDGKE